MNKFFFPLFQVSIFTCCSFLTDISVSAQSISSDGTLPTPTEVTPTAAGVKIDGGTTRGGNLFHSFKDFSVPTGSEAFFNNAPDVVNILNRVTGGNVSNIDGLLRANGNANLFLINPAGIVFGAGARLDIGGSFYGSTADSILFPDGVEFSATDTAAQPILTINAPIGLNFRDNPGDIVNRSNANGVGLSVAEGKSISLIGGNLSIEQSGIVFAPGGRVELGGLIETGTVKFNNDGSLTFPDGIARGDVSLTDSAIVAVYSDGGGSIGVNAANLELISGSRFLGGIRSNLGSVNAQAGDIVVNTTDSVAIDGTDSEASTGIINRVFENGIGNSGNINITTSSLTLSNGGFLSANLSGQGNAGNIIVNAANSVFLDGQGNADTGFFNRVTDTATGNAGNIDITTESLSISNRGQLNAATSGQGSAGDITVDANSLSLTGGSLLNANANSSQGNAGIININANETVSLDGAGTGFFTNVRTAETVGNGGNIEIATGSLSISNQATLDATSFGQGNAGNVTVNASDFVSLEGNDPNSVTNTPIQTFVSGDNAQGNAGNIKINTGSLTLNNGAGLLASNFADGKAGNVIIDATGDVSFANGSSIFVTGAPGGFIDLNAKNLSITSGSNFFAGITSENNSSTTQTGDININLAEDLIIDGLDSDAPTYINNSSFGTGDPGNIEIAARNITFQNGGNISSFSQEQETVKIGNVTLNATGDIVFDGIKSFERSGILNQLPENTSGSIGEINLSAQNLTLTNGAAISSLVSGNGDSSNINIDVANSIKIDGFGESTTENLSGTLASAISTDIFRTGTGNGGNININTQNLELSRNGLISSQVLGKGNGGNININAEQITLGKQGNSNISTSSISVETLSNAEGNGGNITIDTGSLSISDGGEINAGLGGVGNGGNIKINARDVVSVNGTGILDDTEPPSGIVADAFNSVGNAGNIEIDTAKLFVTGGAFVSADILSNGTITNTANGGSITIRASDLVEVSGTGGIEVDVLPEDATGNGGNLTIETGKLTVEEGGSISAISLGSGNAGSLTINAESIFLSGFNEIGRNGIFASALQGSGNGGDINIVTKDLTITDGASIAASNFPSLETSTFSPGTGKPGNINIKANSIFLQNGGRIDAATQSKIGEGANIDLQIADKIILQDNSFISARALGNANGGNISINAPDGFIVAFPNQNNDIIANAQQGQGGDITINARSVFGLEERSLNDRTNDINASSDVFGLEGNIIINTPDVDPFQETREAPENVVEQDEVVAGVCDANQTAQDIMNGTTNSFVVNGKGGVPPTPVEPFSAETLLINGQSVEPGSESPRTPLNKGGIQEQYPPIMTDQGPIYPARGIVKNPDGSIYLSAYPTDNTQRVPNGSANCLH